MSKKKIHYLCDGRIKKSVSRDHRLASIGKPRDPTLTLMIDSYILFHFCALDVYSASIVMPNGDLLDGFSSSNASFPAGDEPQLRLVLSPTLATLDNLEPALPRAYSLIHMHAT